MPETVRERTEVLLRVLDGTSAVHTAVNHPILTADTHSCDFAGRRFWRIVRTTGGREDGQRMVVCFVDNRTGDVLKGSWKAPESRIPRFNIMSREGMARLAFHAGRSQFGWLYFDTIKVSDEAMEA